MIWLNYTVTVVCIYTRGALLSLHSAFFRLFFLNEEIDESRAVRSLPTSGEEVEPVGGGGGGGGGRGAEDEGGGGGGGGGTGVVGVGGGVGGTGAVAEDILSLDWPKALPGNRV